MKCHPHEDAVRFRPVFGLEGELSGEGSADSSRRGIKRREECVASGLEDMAALTLDALAQYFVVPVESHPHRIGVRFPQLRAAFDVREQERDCACCETGGAMFRSHS
jgi:hypothetical protein